MRKLNSALFFFLARTVTEHYFPDRLKCIIVNIHNFKISNKINRKNSTKLGTNYSNFLLNHLSPYTNP